MGEDFYSNQRQVICLLTGFTVSSPLRGVRRRATRTLPARTLRPANTARPLLEPLFVLSTIILRFTPPPQLIVDLTKGELLQSSKSTYHMKFLHILRILTVILLNYTPPSTSPNHPRLSTDSLQGHQFY